jgi:superfamily II DNA/RNA helicase
VHGDLGQGAREQALRAFRNGKVDVLVATDVAARGIDVDDVTHVINWECPDDDKTYLHRIGRTGRAGNSGVAITLVDWDDLHKWKMINQTLGLPFDEPIETYSSSPHVYTGLGIPAGTKGRLPKTAQTRAGLDAEVIEDLGETGAAAGKRNRGKGSGDRDRDRDHGRGKADGKRDERPRREDRPKDKDAAGDRPRRERRRTRSGEDPATSAASADAEKPTASSATSAAPADADGGATAARTSRVVAVAAVDGRGGASADEAQAATD